MEVVIPHSWVKMVEDYRFKNFKRRLNIFYQNPNYAIRYFSSRLITNSFLPLIKDKGIFLSEITILITHLCNQNCPMCPQWGKFGLWKNEDKDTLIKSELPLLVWKEFIDQIVPFKPNLIVLSGGEPLLFPHWQELAEYIKSKGIRLCLLTNGILMENYLKEISELVDSLHISLYFYKNEKNEESLSKILRSIKRLAEFKKEKNRKFPWINIVFTITDFNYLKLLRTMEYILKNEINIDSFIFQYSFSLTEKKLEEHKKVFQEYFQIESSLFSGYLYKSEGIKEEVVSVIKKIRKEYANVVFIPDLNPEEVISFYQDADYLPKKYQRKICLAPWLQITVLPEGEVWICPDYSIGNIKKDKLKDIWNNKRARILRRRLYQDKLFPACGRCCFLYNY